MQNKDCDINQMFYSLFLRLNQATQSWLLGVSMCLGDCKACAPLSLRICFVPLTQNGQDNPIE
jgi:hypothetical protein